MFSFPFRVLISIPLSDVFPVKPRHFHEKMVQEDAKQSDDGSERVSKKKCDGTVWRHSGRSYPHKKENRSSKVFWGSKVALAVKLF